MATPEEMGKIVLAMIEQLEAGDNGRTVMHRIITKQRVLDLYLTFSNIPHPQDRLERMKQYAMSAGQLREYLKPKED